VWIAAASGGEHPLESVYTEDDQGERRLLAEGYAFERCVTTAGADGAHTWNERVLVVRFGTLPPGPAGRAGKNACSGPRRGC